MNYYNPYMQNQFVPQQRFVPDQQFTNQFNQPMQQPIQNNTPAYKPTGLQGKIVDSIDVVKATDVTLDRKYKLFSFN